MRRLYYSPFFGPPASVGLLVLRVVAGLALMLHGWPKIQKAFSWMGPDSWAPGFLQALAAFAEFGGGLALILGLLTPLACLLVMATMATAIFSVHVPHGDPFVKSGPGGGSYELAALYLAIACTLLFTGPGRNSLDYLLFFRKDDVAFKTPEETREKVSV